MRRALVLGLAWTLMCGAAGCESNEAKQRAGAVGPEATSAEPAARPARPSPSESFSVEWQASALTVGEPGEMTLLITPGPGLKINPAYPWKLVVDEVGTSEQVEVSSAKIARDQMKLEDARASIPVGLTARAAGTHTFEANVSLSVCEKGDEARCLWFKDEPVTFEVVAN